VQRSKCGDRPQGQLRSDRLTTTMGFVSTVVKAHIFLLLACVANVAFMLLFAFPWMQRHFLFMHKVPYPISPDFDSPHKYNLAPGIARNVRIISTDNVTLGAWHHLPDTLYEEYKHLINETSSALPDEVYLQALREFPTFVYLHGNAMNRAAPFRVETYQLLSETMHANVIAIDYRGFGDSSGYPSEEGVIDDAYATVAYVRENSEDPETGKSPALTIMGQSLGTGVASQAALRLYNDEVPFDGVVLLAPFKDIKSLVTEFRVAGLFPVFGMLEYIPQKEQLLDQLLLYSFNTTAAMKEFLDGNLFVDAPHPPTVLVMHAVDDDVIPVHHGEQLYLMVEDHFMTRRLDSSFHAWGSRIPDIGYVQSVLRKSEPNPERLGRVPGARAVLPRNALTTYLRLNRGGHNHLFSEYSDLLPLLLPQNMTGRAPTAT